MEPITLEDALRELRQRREEIERLSNELEETNRGVLALYAELDDRASMLRNANELKDQFLSYLSHEFRTPLNSISALSEFLLQELSGPVNEEQRKQAQYIRKSALDLLEMVNDLLDVAKIESGRVDVRTEDVSVSDIFAGLRGTMRPLLVSNSVELIFEEPGEVAVLHTDAAKLTQILRNLISNALKFTEAGEVRVLARMKDAARVEFSVSDTGIGINAEARERIFEAFEQVDSPLQRKVKGTGLGLSLSRRLASVLGGTLKLDDTEGPGCTFTVELPLDSTALPSLDGVNILIVDDDEATRYLLASGLGGAAARIGEASSGDEALKALRAGQFHVVVLDLGMPGMSGDEVVDAIRNDEALRSVRIIIHSAEELDGARRTALESPVHAIIPKGPRSISALAASIADATSSSSTAAT